MVITKFNISINDCPMRCKYLSLHADRIECVCKLGRIPKGYEVTDISRIPFSLRYSEVIKVKRVTCPACKLNKWELK